MTLISFGSVAGSPGVTRLAIGVASAWPRAGQRRVVVEADPDGGRLGAELGIGIEPGLMAVALAVRNGELGAEELLVTGAAAVGSWFAMPAPSSGEQSSSMLAHASTALAGAMGAAGDHVWLVDTGRLSTRSPSLPFATSAEQVVVVSSGSFAALQLVPARVDALQRAGCRVGLVVVEPTPWPVGEVADFAGADVLAVLPQVRNGHRDDVRAMSGGGWRSWWRAVERLAAVLAGGGDVAHPVIDDPVAAPMPAAPRWPS